MTQQELLSRLQQLLEIHLDCGYLRQEPYKSDLFSVFATAYNSGYFEERSNPSLKGDSLRELLVAQWFRNTDTQAMTERRRELLGQLLPMWEEWRYALDRWASFSTEQG